MAREKPRERLIRYVEDSPERHAWVTESWSGTGEEYELSIWKDSFEVECTCMDSMCRKHTANLGDPRTDGNGCKHIRALLERLRRR